MVGFCVSEGWKGNCFDEQIVKFLKFQLLGEADGSSQMTIYSGQD